MDKRMIDDITREFEECHSFPSKCLAICRSKKVKYEQPYVDISDYDMEEIHFNKFERLPYMKSETNRMYLTRILGLENIAVPTSYLARGMENVVYKAKGVGHYKGDDLIIRVARFGDEEYDTTYTWSENSYNVQSSMYRIFSESNGSSKKSIPVPEMVFRKEVHIGNTIASVQISDLVVGETLEGRFNKGGKMEMKSLIFKFGNTLGHLHWENQVCHGDYHAMNVMDSTPSHSEFLTIIDMDRSIDYSHNTVLTDSDLSICMDYDLTQALSSIFKMIAIRFKMVKKYRKRKEKLFKIFMDAYNKHRVSSCGIAKEWRGIIHIDENTHVDCYMDVLEDGFSGYDGIFNSIIGV